jgi:hypothetical protein
MGLSSISMNLVFLSENFDGLSAGYAFGMFGCLNSIGACCEIASDT